MEDNKELLEAQAHIWNHTFKYINSMSLKCVVELGIPDIIHSHGQPMSFSDLVEVLHIPPSKTQCLRRLMRLLVHSGFFSQTQGENDDEEEVRYGLTPSSRFLRRHNTTLDASPFLFLALHRAMMAPWETMSSWLCSEDEYSTAFEMVNNGKTIWSYMVDEPEFGNLFRRAMVYDSEMIGRLVTKECPEVFEGLKSMVDVGGGEGIMAKAIVEAFPHITCTVFDFPEGVSKNLNFVAPIIPPTDAVLLKSVLHLWNDEECIGILRNCKDAICSGESGKKVIIIEAVLENQMELDKESTETELCGDVLMMANFTNPKRNVREWKNIILTAGFSNYNITSLKGVRSVIEVFPS